VDDEPAVDGVGADLVGVGVPAETVVGLEQGDVGVAAQCPGGGQPGDSAPDDGDARDGRPLPVGRAGSDREP
jgi:hypothetical protein